MTGWASGAEICRSLKGKWGAGHKGRAPCPAHGSDNPESMSIAQLPDGRILVHCFVGCSQVEVIQALRQRGLWGDGPLVGDPSVPYYLSTPRDGLSKPSKLERSQAALAIWDKCRSAKGTLAEAYLRARGITLPIPDEIRFHPGLKYHGTHDIFPCMVAKITDNSGFCAVQRTFLDPKEPKKAPVTKPKLSKGGMGTGAVRLRPAGQMLGLAEGIETALSARQLYSIPVWATLSAMRLSKIEMPDGVEQITIFADTGEVGRKEAFKAAEIYEHKGYAAEVIFPGAHFQGENNDFNSILQARG